MTHQYSRAERLLTRPFHMSPPKAPATPPPHTNGHIPHLSSTKGKGRELIQQPPVSIPRLPMGPGGVIEVPEDMLEGVSRLVDMSVACRYLAAQCQVCTLCSLVEVKCLIGRSGPTGQLGRSYRNAWGSKSFPWFRYAYTSSSDMSLGCSRFRPKWSSNPEHRWWHQGGRYKLHVR